MNDRHLERIETFERDGKQIVCFDLSDIKTNEELREVVQMAKEKMSGYAFASVITITTISGIMFDTKTKEIAADWMAFNKPYVANAAVIGASGVRKIMAGAVFALSGRTDIKLFQNREQALAWIDTL